MKKPYLLLLLLCATLMAHAQDTILMQNGHKILAKVLEINPDNVKYKPYNNPGGPIVTVEKEDVLSIKYANGSNEAMLAPENRNNASHGKREKKEGRIHGWYLGASLSIGGSNVSSSDPAYTVAGSVYSGDGLYAAKMFSQHLGIQFGLATDDYAYNINFNNGAGANTFTLNCLSIPLRVIYMSNSKKRAGLYATAGFDLSLLTSAKVQNSYLISNYYTTGFIAPYVSAGFEFRTRSASTVFFVGPYFKTSLGNIYSSNDNNSLGLNPGNKGSVSSFGITIACMSNFGRKSRNRRS